MELFISLLLKILPLYLLIFTGYLVGKYLKAQKDTVAVIVIYTITPVIIFHGALTADLGYGTLLLPLIYFSIATTLCLTVYKLTKNHWPDNTRNILAFSSGTGNTGYFGLPVAIALFGEKAISTVALLVIGGVIYETTIGFFIVARGRHTAMESIKKLLKLPIIYMFILGLILNLLHFPVNQVYLDTISLYRGAYTILGMMIIGLALAEIGTLKIDNKFLSLAFAVRFILWPLMMVLVIFLDINFFRLLSYDIYNVMFLISLVPLAANTVSYASLLQVQPQKAAVAVLASTIFALFYIPFIISIFLKI